MRQRGRRALCRVEAPLQFRETPSVFHPHAQLNARSDSLRLLVSTVRSIGGYKPPVPVPKTQLAFHPRAPRTVDCRRSASAIQIVRPSGSTADTQSQLQPASWRRSAMIPQYFTNPPFSRCSEPFAVIHPVANRRIQKLSPSCSPGSLPSFGKDTRHFFPDLRTPNFKLEALH